MKTKAKRILFLLGLGLCVAPVATYYAARQQLPARIRIPVRADDLRFSSVQLSRYAGIQIQFRASASANLQLRELMTRITPVWSLLPIERQNSEWLVNPYSGSGIYWDDYALTQ